MTAALIDRALLVLLAASTATLLAALGFQYIGGLDPCVLCIYQRWPYIAVAVVCAVALVARGMTPAALFVCAAALIVGAGVAGFHVGVEQGWWAGTAGCFGSSGAPTVDELRSQIMGGPVAHCGEVAWALLGISMAGYNFLISLGLACVSVLAGLRWQAGHIA